MLSNFSNFPMIPNKLNINLSKNYHYQNKTLLNSNTIFCI